jgi:hypothetical protein
MRKPRIVRDIQLNRLPTRYYALLFSYCKNRKQNRVLRSMKQQLKRVIFFPALRQLRMHGHSLQRRRIRTIGGIQSVFTTIYEEHLWGSEESVSGSGSPIEYTKNIMKEIPQIISDLKVTRMLDAPCGDYNWFRLIERDDDLSYIGGDIVEAFIISNQARHGDDKTCFMHLDITNDACLRADFWLCRDCLPYLPNDDISK